jgi:hypothetical protein
MATASSQVWRGTQLGLAMMVLMQLLEVACGAKRKTTRDDESEDTMMDMVWAGLKLAFAFSPFIGLFFFMFCSAFESKEKEKLKRAKKHGALHLHNPSAYRMLHILCVSSKVRSTQSPQMVYLADFQMGDGTGD